MRPFGKIAVYFAGTILVLLLLWSTVSVYMLDQYERAWGRGGSVQVLWMLSVTVALLTLFSSGLGAKAAFPQRHAPAIASALAALLFVGISAILFWLLPSMHQDVALFGFLAWISLGPAILGFGLITHYGREISNG